MVKFFALFLLFNGQGSLENIGVRKEPFDSITECKEYVLGSVNQMTAELGSDSVIRVDGTCLPYKWITQVSD